MKRVVDLDVDIGADAVDYKYVFLFYFPQTPIHHLFFFLAQLPTKNRSLVLKRRCVN